MLSIEALRGGDFKKPIPFCEGILRGALVCDDWTKRIIFTPGFVDANDFFEAAGLFFAADVCFSSFSGEWL